MAIAKCKPEKTERDYIESAIRSLYVMFPDLSGCHRARTRECIDIEKKIKARKDELENDAKLKSLQKTLADTKKAAVERSKAKHREVDALMRRLNLRGVTEDLIRDVEKLAKEPAVVTYDDCE